VVDVPETHFCCGSAGTYNLLQPRVAEQLGERKARHAESTGAAMLAVGNVGCVMQISRYTELPVLHTVELLDWATGGPTPPNLRDKPLTEFVAPASSSSEFLAQTPQDPTSLTNGIGIW
jgi:glycolate oxidase iron-sulfur subunit